MSCTDYEDWLALGAGDRFGSSTDEPGHGPADALADALTEEQAEELEEHLASCEACRRLSSLYEADRARLRSLAPAALKADEVAHLMAAAFPEPALSGVVPERRRQGWPLWLSHAAAVVAGVLLAGAGARFGWFGSQVDGLGDGLPTELAAAAPEVREVRVEVPVEVVVEKRVEVPVPVEVRIEVPVERVVYRERVVAHPLQARWDGQLRLGEAVADMGSLALRGFRDAALALDAGRIAVPLSVPLAGAEGAGPPADVGPTGVRSPGNGDERTAERASDRRRRPGLEVRREGGSVTLRTRGSLGQVVPVLIDALDGDDDLVVAAATDRLLTIRSNFGERAVALRTRGSSPRRRQRSLQGGLRGSRGGARAAQDTEAIDSSELWRSWWARQRASSGVAIASATL